MKAAILLILEGMGKVERIGNRFGRGLFRFYVASRTEKSTGAAVRFLEPGRRPCGIGRGGYSALERIRNPVSVDRFLDHGVVEQVLEEVGIFAGVAVILADDFEGAEAQ